MTKCIIDGVLLSLPEGFREYQAETSTGLPVRFTYHDDGWHVTYGYDPEQKDSSPSFSLLDAVQKARRSVKFKRIEANSTARKGTDANGTVGWIIQPHAHDKDPLFVPSRGRTATLSDLMRRTNLLITPGTPVAANVVPIYWVGG